MNSYTSRKIIVASGMAVVVGIGVVIFALRVHSETSVAQTPHPSTPPVAQIPADAPPAAAQIPTAPAAVAQTPEAPPAAVAHNDSVGTKSAETATPSAVEPKLARNRHPAKASADELTTKPATKSPTADDQKAGTSTGFAASDNQITSDVNSQIAGDSLSKDGKIAVTTTRGVVVLTGSLASQDAIDHVKDVAGKVPGVKSVDTSALVLASL